MSKVKLPLLPLEEGATADDGNDRHNSQKLQKKKSRGSGIFNHFNLTMDRRTAKYMPYSRVAFPRLGFSSTSTSDAKKQKQKYDESNRQVCERQEVDTQLNAAAPSPIVGQGDKAALETLWMVGFLDQDKEAEKSVALAKIEHLLNLPDGRLLPRTALNVRRIYEKEARKARAKGSGSNDKLVQAELGFDLRVRGPALVPNLPRGANTKKARRSPFDIYGKENERIRRVLMGAGAVIKLESQLHARGMDELFEVKRAETEASLMIQKCWRRYQRLCYWHRFMIETEAAVKIQAVVRGVISRMLILRWHVRRSWFVVVAQSSIRRVLSAKHTRTRVAIESLAVIAIQKVVRLRLSRLRVAFLLRRQACIRIQRLWRGSVGRASADRLWLCNLVTRIQSLCRGFLARQVTSRDLLRLTLSCVKLQRCYRGMAARHERDRLLWAREIAARRRVLDRLRAEDQHQVDVIAKQEKRIVKSKAEALCLQLRTELDKASLKVRELEYNLIHLNMERLSVSPRAMAQGWTDELDKNIVDHRSQVTEAKLKFLFEDALKLRKITDTKDESLRAVADARWRLSCVREGREAELEALRSKQEEWQWRTMKTDHKRAVAQQRRRFAIKLINGSGKPLNSTVVRSSPFAPDVAPKVNSQENAFTDSVPDADASMFEHLNAKVQSQNARNVIQQYSAVLKPLFKTMVDAQLELQVRGFPPKKTETNAEDVAALIAVGGTAAAANNGETMFASKVPWEMVTDLQRRKAKMKRHLAKQADTQVHELP